MSDPITELLLLVAEVKKSFYRLKGHHSRLFGSFWLTTRVTNTSQVQFDSEGSRDSELLSSRFLWKEVGLIYNT